MLKVFMARYLATIHERFVDKSPAHKKSATPVDDDQFFDNVANSKRVPSFAEWMHNRLTLKKVFQRETTTHLASHRDLLIDWGADDTRRQEMFESTGVPEGLRTSRYIVQRSPSCQQKTCWLPCSFQPLPSSRQFCPGMPEATPGFLRVSEAVGL
jgi:hypothetical protein